MNDNGYNIPECKECGEKIIIIDEVEHDCVKDAAHIAFENFINQPLTTELDFRL